MLQASPMQCLPRCIAAIVLRYRADHGALTMPRKPGAKTMKKQSTKRSCWSIYRNRNRKVHGEKPGQLLHRIASNLEP